jgi:hypothetical protein
MDTYEFHIDGQLIATFQTDYNAKYIFETPFGLLDKDSTRIVKILSEKFGHTLSENSIINLEECQSLPFVNLSNYAI